MRYKFMTHVLSASALTLVMGSAAFAQQEPMQQEPMQQEPMDQEPMDQAMEQQAEVDFANSYKASTLQDLDVNDMQGETIGKIGDMLIDDQGTVSHVVVMEEGGLLGGGGQSYVIPWDQVQFDEQQRTASVNVSQDQLSTEFSAFEELPPTKLEQAQQQETGDMQQQPEGMGESPDSQMQ